MQPYLSILIVRSVNGIDVSVEITSEIYTIALIGKIIHARSGEGNACWLRSPSKDSIIYSNRVYGFAATPVICHYVGVRKTARK